jgi:hypothetical protein
MSLPIYSTGTVSVAAGGTNVTGAGVMWSGINVKQGDFISIAGLAEVLITEVTDAANLKITPWQGAAQSNAPYIIYQNYVGRVVGVAAAEDVGEMLEKLHVDGLPFIVGADETVPDPSYGDEGQLAFKPSTGQWWVKQGGVWVSSAGLTALGYGGTSATSLLIGTGTKTFTTQGGLAYDGARVRAASAANPNNWMEGVADYFDVTLTMTSDKIHGSGTHSDWLFSIAGQPGVDGLGAGDVMGPASAVIDNIATFADTTGKQIKDGSVKISDLVRYDIAQTLTEAQKVQARSNIYAAPFDALSYSGLQINGSMEVSQELGAAATVLPATASFQSTYVLDNWKVEYRGTFSITARQVDILSWFGSNALPGHKNALLITVGTAQGSIGANDQAVITTAIEGYRIARLSFGYAAASPMTVAFMINVAVGGTYSGSIRNGDGTRSYPFSFTLASSVFTYVTVTIPGDVAGAWVTNNNRGMLLSISLAVGTAFTAPANAWVAGNFIGVNGTANGVASTSHSIYITGVVVLPGIEAPTAAQSPLIMRPFDQELLTCQRYYYKGIPPLRGVIYAASSNLVSRAGARHPVTMRATPAITMAGLPDVFDGTSNASVISLGTSTSTADIIEVDCNLNGNLIGGRPAIVYGGGAFYINARL